VTIAYVSFIVKPVVHLSFMVPVIVVPTHLRYSVPRPHGWLSYMAMSIGLLILSILQEITSFTNRFFAYSYFT